MTPNAAVAAIDCGTNSTRLLVLSADGDVVERHMRITRLGEGVDSTHKLAPEAISRTVDVLNDYRKIMDANQVVAARLVATSATRDATNAEEFFTAAELATGIRPELLTGDEEGRLSFLGATTALPQALRDGEPLLVVDIGGGSTELVIGRAPTADLDEGLVDLDTVAALSLDIGCVRVSERFFSHDPPSSEELEEARSFVGSNLRIAKERLPALNPSGPVVGLAGTVSTIAALELGVASYERSAIHHALLSRELVATWADVLEHEKSAARLARPGMVLGREDVIAGGALVLLAVMEVFDRSRCLVSEDDILDGLARTVRSELKRG